MALIRFGEINKNIIYLLIGAISKFVANLIIYTYRNDIKLNHHPFLLGINAGFGMSLAIIPYLYILKYTKTPGNETLNNNNKNDDKYVDNLFKKNDPIVQRDKYLVIFLCSFLDFAQKVLVFLCSNNLSTNFWIFNIIFLNIFTSMVTKNQLYKHQYFSSGVMILFGIFLNVINLNGMNSEDIPMLIFNILIEMIYCLGIVLAKHGMDDLFCSPFEITFYEGIFALILNIIFLIISTNIPIPFEKILFVEKLFKRSEYDGKQYLDNFYKYIEEIDFKEAMLFIVTMVGRVMFNLFSHITIKHFTSSHVVLILILGESALLWNKKDTFELIIISVIFIVELLMLLIFCEIIELNFCGFEKNTRKNIKERAGTAVFDECGINMKEIGQGNELNADDDDSFNESFGGVN